MCNNWIDNKIEEKKREREEEKSKELEVTKSNKRKGEEKG